MNGALGCDQLRHRVYLQLNEGVSTTVVGCMISKGADFISTVLCRVGWTGKGTRGLFDVPTPLQPAAGRAAITTLTGNRRWQITFAPTLSDSRG